MATTTAPPRTEAEFALQIIVLAVLVGLAAAAGLLL
jgi:hypothetical protein